MALAGSLAVWLVAGAGLVFGHASYDYSTPANGEVLTTPPARVDMWTSQRVDIAPGNNSMNVLGPDGRDVDNNDFTIDPQDREHLSITLQSGLGSGVYTVQWATVSFDDGDAASGSFTFTLQLAEEPPTPTVASVPTEPAAPTLAEGGGSPTPPAVSGMPPSGGGPQRGSGGATGATVAALASASGALLAVAGAALRRRRA